MVSRKLKTAQSYKVQPRNEYLQVADVVAHEKGIDTREVLEAMSAAIQHAARAKYGMEYDIRAHIDPHSGVLDIVKVMTVVDDVTNHSREVSLKDALLQHKDSEIGDTMEEDLPFVDFGRIAAQTAKSVITQRVRDSERKRQMEQFQGKIGHIVSGLVKRLEYGNVIVDLGQGEGILKRDDLIPREIFRVGDRVRAILTELKPENRGPIACLSRTTPLLLARLFEQEVPEIYEGVIDVKFVARDPGSRAKMSVFTHDASLDPVGSCVGVRGSRVQAVIAELQGEKVDIIPWSEDVATYIVSALQPASVLKVIIDEDARRVDVIVEQDQLSLAIGRRGQNVRLASILVGWSIDVMTEEEETGKRLEENASRVEDFIKALDVDEVLAQLLCSEGFFTLEDIAFIDISDFAAIEGFDEALAIEIQNRAISVLSKKREELDKKIIEHKVEQRLIDLIETEEALDSSSLNSFIDNGIVSFDDLGELSGDELLDLLGRHSMTLAQANEIIMKARAHWFE